MIKKREWVGEPGFSGKELEQILNTIVWTIFQIQPVSRRG
jgi:hypothetical protein